MRTVKLGRILGIRIGADSSWFLALFLVILLLGGRFERLESADQATGYLLGVAAATLFFFSLVAHELGHAVVGRRFGMQTKGIDLWLLGGVAHLDRDSRRPGEEFWVAFAGPLVTAALFGAFVGIGSLAVGGPGDLLDAALLRGADGTTNLDVTPLAALTGWLALVNAILFVFNMIPAFPLDGGRIARAIAWRVTGDRRRGTVAAGNLGRGFALLLAAFGVWRLMDGSAFDGVWALLLAWFIGTAARAAVATSEISEQLHAVTAGSLLEDRPAWVPLEETAIEADASTFAPFGVAWAPVADEAGRYHGVLTADRVRTELAEGRPTTPVRSLIDPDDAPSAAPDDTLDGLLASEPLRRLGALPVVDRSGVLHGLVTFATVREALARAIPGGAGRDA
ncbi:MAG: site-2 protease family protein [Solirubrobacteraceae bacterium]|nr:site-2 protease family protein [Solirubrobacteraceae bacterium]